MGCGFTPPGVGEVEESTKHGPTMEWTALLWMLGLEEVSTDDSSHYCFKHLESGGAAGRVHYIKGLLNQKATCRFHSDCTCWIKLNRKDACHISLLRSLVEWLAGGAETDRATHQLAAGALKRSWGMKPRDGHGE